MMMHMINYMHVVLNEGLPLFCPLLFAMSGKNAVNIVVKGKKPSIRTKYKDLQFAVGPFSISV